MNKKSVQRLSYLNNLHNLELISTEPAQTSMVRGNSDRYRTCITLYDYLQLIDWTGRQLVAGKAGAIPDSFAPILQRLGIVKRTWCDLVKDFGKLFRRGQST